MRRNPEAPRNSSLRSSSQLTDAQFRPQPTEVVTRHRAVVITGLGGLVFRQFEPLRDLDPSPRGLDRGARRLASERGNRLIEHAAIVPVHLIMDDGAKLLFGDRGLLWLGDVARCHARSR